MGPTHARAWEAEGPGGGRWPLRWEAFDSITPYPSSRALSRLLRGELRLPLPATEALGPDSSLSPTLGSLFSSRSKKSLFSGKGRGGAS